LLGLFTSYCKYGGRPVRHALNMASIDSARATMVSGDRTQAVEDVAARRLQKEATRSDIFSAGSAALIPGPSARLRNTSDS
jgi:hypothetical protein